MIDRRQSSFSFRGQFMTSFLQSSSENMEWKLETRTADSDFSVILADGRPQQKHRPVCTVPLTVKIADESEKQSFTTFLWQGTMSFREDLGWRRIIPRSNFKRLRWGLDCVHLGRLASSWSDQESPGEDPDFQLNFIWRKQAHPAPSARWWWTPCLGHTELEIPPKEWSMPQPTRVIVKGRIYRSFSMNSKMSFRKEERPTTLPPQCTTAHHIEVLPGPGPPWRPPYQLPKPSLDELQFQLEALLENKKKAHWAKQITFLELPISFWRSRSRIEVSCWAVTGEN